MKNYTKKITAAVLGGLFLLNAAGCKDKEKEEYQDEADLIGSMAQEDMPYGATITQLKPSIDENVKIAIEFDNRYLTVEEAYKLSDYVASLNDCDGALMEKTFYKPFLDSIVEQSGAADAEEYVTGVHNNIRDNYIGYEFKFDYVLTQDCLTEADDDSETGFSSVDASLDKLGDEKLSDKVTSRKCVTFDLEYQIDGSDDSYMMSTSTGTSSTLYIYTIDGEIYIL